MSRQSMRVLLAFEAVGRHLSFSKAAEELNVSQSAISRNVAALEADLSCRLVERTTRHCVLTPSGEALHAELAAGLTQIQSALEIVRGNAKEKLNISVSPFLSVAWFTPRLLKFIDGNPNLEIKLIHSYQPPQFESGSVDIGINWGRKSSDKRIRFELAVPGDLIPACSPAFAADNLDPSDPSSLLDCPLFHEFDKRDWFAWFSRVGLDEVACNSQQISDTSALRQAAILGNGVALLFRELVKEDIGNGLLVSPFAHSVPTGRDYWLTYPVEHETRPAVRRFLNWFRGQIPNQNCR